MGPLGEAQHADGSNDRFEDPGRALRGFWWGPELLVTPPSFNIAPAKMRVGRLLSFWNSKFSGAMLNFQGVLVIKWSYVINPALLGTNISHLWKRKIIFKKWLGRGYVSSLQGITWFYKLVSLGIFHTCKWSNGLPITGFGRGFGGLQFDKSWQNLIRYLCIFFSGNYQLFLDNFLMIYATKEVCMFFQPWNQRKKCQLVKLFINPKTIGINTSLKDHGNFQVNVHMFFFFKIYIYIYIDRGHLEFYNFYCKQEHL